MSILIVVIIATVLVAGIGGLVYFLISRSSHKKEVLENSKLNEMGAGYLGATPQDQPMANDNITTGSTDNAGYASAQPAMNDIVGAAMPDNSVPQPPEMQTEMPQMGMDQPSAEPVVSDMAQQNMTMPSDVPEPGMAADTGADMTGQSGMDGQLSDTPTMVEEPVMNSAIPPVQEEEIPSDEPAVPVNTIPVETQPEEIAPEADMPETGAYQMEEVSIPIQTPAQPEPAMPQSEPAMSEMPQAGSQTAAPEALQTENPTPQDTGMTQNENQATPMDEQPSTPEPAPELIVPPADTQVSSASASGASSVQPTSENPEPPHMDI